MKLLKIGYYCYYDVTASEISVASNYVSIILLQLFTSAFIKIYIREKTGNYLIKLTSTGDQTETRNV